MKPGHEAGLRWLRQAEHDLEVARRLQDLGDYSDACFMAEQASQKALKAFLLAQGERSVPIHSVAQLAESCSRIDPNFEEHIAPGRLLDQYYIPTRYPDALPPPAVPLYRGAGREGARSSPGHRVARGRKAYHRRHALTPLFWNGTSGRTIRSLPDDRRMLPFAVRTRRPSRLRDLLPQIWPTDCNPLRAIKFNEQWQIIPQPRGRKEPLWSGAQCNDGTWDGAGAASRGRDFLGGGMPHYHSP